jgi:hypothetical protein
MIKIDVRTHFRTGKPCPQFMVDGFPVTDPLDGLEGCLISIFMKASGKEGYSIFHQLDEPLELGEVDLKGRLRYESRRYEEFLGLAFEFHNKIRYESEKYREFLDFAFEFHNKLLCGLKVPDRDY